MANTVIFPNGSSFTDDQGNVWSINAQDQVVMNGNPDPNTTNVVEMADVNGVVWQENAAQLWWNWSPSSADNFNGWSPSAGTSVSPLGDGGGVRTLNWTGGGVTQDANDPNNWSPAGPPQPGDVLTMSSGTMLITSNYNLAGDTLSLTSGPSLKVTLNMAGGGSANVAVDNQTLGLQLNGNMGGIELSDGLGLLGTVNLAINTDLVVTGSMDFVAGFDASGVGSHLTNNGTIGLSKGKLDVDLDGTGTYNVHRYHDRGGNVEVTGPVAPGLTFNLQGESSTFNAGLTIDRPAEFQGNVTVGSGPSGPSVDLLTLTGLGGADSYDLKNDLLSIYQGNTVIDTVNLKTNGEPYTVATQGGNVGVYIGMDAPSGASILPLHV